MRIGLLRCLERLRGRVAMSYVFNGILAGVENNQVKVIPDDAEIYVSAENNNQNQNQNQRIIAFPVKDANNGNRLLAVYTPNNNQDLERKVVRLQTNINNNLLALFKVGERYSFHFENGNGGTSNSSGNSSSSNNNNCKKILYINNNNSKITSIEIPDDVF